MTGMEHAIERAEALVCGVFDDAPDEGLNSFDFAREIVRALADNGLIAPAPNETSRQHSAPRTRGR